jgi:hypothetical protein
VGKLAVVVKRVSCARTALRPEVAGEDIKGSLQLQRVMGRAFIFGVRGKVCQCTIPEAFRALSRVYGRECDASVSF